MAERGPPGNGQSMSTLLDAVTFGRGAEVKQMMRFALVGVFNTAFGYGLIFGCMYLLGMPPIPSNVAGYGIGLLFAYLLHRNFTFGSTGTHRREAVRFLVVFGLAYSANLAVLYVLTHRLGVSGGLSQVVSGAVYVASSFLLSKCFVFTEVGPPAAAKTGDGPRQLPRSMGWSPPPTRRVAEREPRS